MLEHLRSPDDVLLTFEDEGLDDFEELDDFDEDEFEDDLYGNDDFNGNGDYDDFLEDEEEEEYTH
jgi:hypothetical protein